MNTESDPGDAASPRHARETVIMDPRDKSGDDGG
jgi:hypothetical protein